MFGEKSFVENDHKINDAPLVMDNNGDGIEGHDLVVTEQNESIQNDVEHVVSKVEGYNVLVTEDRNSLQDPTLDLSNFE